MNKTVEVISLIYKSPKYLKHIIEEFTSDRNNVFEWDVHYKIVANDPTQQIIDSLNEYAMAYPNISFNIYNDLKPKDYYINRVYRCYNHSAETSIADAICFVNSDMIFNKGWLNNLFKYYSNSTIPCSRLVESGRLRSGTYGIEKDFGKTVDELNREGFFEYAKSISIDTYKDGGLYMPFIINREQFIDSGMYPEGNIYEDNMAGSMNGNVIASGDLAYFSRLRYLYGMRHVTVFDSIVYHVQEGEKQE